MLREYVFSGLTFALSLLIAWEAQGADKLSARWRVPWYRDAVYASQRITTAELMVTVDGRPQDFAEYGLYAEVVGDRAGVFWRKLRRQRYRPVERENLLEFDTFRMGYEEHAVRLVLFTREDRRLLTESEISLRKLAPAPGEVCPARDGTLLVNAQPTFVLGVATRNCEGKTLARLAAAGLNVVIDTNPGHPAAIQKFLDAARIHRMLAVPPFVSPPADEQAQSHLVKHEMDEALLAWHSGTTRPVPETRYREFVDLSVYRPLISLVDVNSIAATEADIVVAAPAVPNRKTVLEPAALLLWAEAIAERTARGRPTWAMIPLSLARNKAKVQTSRLLAWLAVTAGAQGVVFGDDEKGTFLEPDYPGWKSTAGVSRELSQVRAALAAGATKPLVLDAETPLRTRAVYHELRWLVVVVNPTGKLVQASLSVPDMCAGVHLRVVGESRGITTASSGGPTGHAVIADAFKPYQVHVYTNVDETRK